MDKATKVAIAMLLSTAISERPERAMCYRADWESEDHQNPDLVIGHTNDWWLKTRPSDGSLYVQSRYTNKDVGNSVSDAVERMRRILITYQALTGIEVALPNVGGKRS